MEQTAAPPLPAGSMLAHYRLEEPVGEGAMGRVYRARDEGLDRTVAVKVLRPGTTRMSMRVDRFFREARAAARVNHPNLCHVYYVGGDGSYRFFAMEYVHGRSLDEYLEEEGPPDFEVALDILMQAAEGLAAAHDAGIVHRDVKPSNILVRPDGSVKITDFGLSKSLEGDPNVSQEGTVTGTPTFMSPEQCRGLKVDARTDIYGLGLTAWTMLTGRAPYPGENLGQVIDDQLHAPLPSLGAERPDVPRSLERVIAHMCEKDRDKRPADMHKVVDLLEGCRPRAVHPAPVMARAVAVTIDLLLVLVMVAAVEFPIERYGGFQIPDRLNGVFVALLFGLTTLYGELRHGQTWGKWFLNLAVRSSDGSEPRRRAILARFALRFPGVVVWGVAIPWLHAVFVSAANLLTVAAVAAGLIAFYVTKGRSFSDVLTMTRVVYSMPPDERKPRRRRR
jgi:tRNA A-37 threonylcarbamoyl transferase component Bud32